MYRVRIPQIFGGCLAIAVQDMTKMQFMGLPPSGVVFLSLAATCAIICGFLTHQEIGEVNRRLPDNQQIPYPFMYPGKMRKIRALYKQFYPNGRVDFWGRFFEWSGFVFLALTAVAGGFLR